MKTILLKVKDKKLKAKAIALAAKIIREGGLVAFPTETVYGLGADALNSKAVKRIYEVKGRPPDNPIIVHIAEKNDIYKLAKCVPKKAKKLVQKFWPGPLTLVLKKAKKVPKITTGGLDTIAIRMPANEIALALIKKSHTPIAAPSANLSGKPSPTSTSHVLHDLNGKIEAIIDGGKTKIGVESTVLDLTTEPPTLLRPGGVTLEELEKVLGSINIPPYIKGKGFKGVAKSPGMKYRHYAPEAKLILVEGRCEKVVKKIRMLVKKYRKEGKVVGVMTTQKTHKYDANIVKFVGSSDLQIAKNLFKTLRVFDKKGVDIIIAEGVKEKGLGFAIMNRLRKAACEIIKV